ncbi:MAG: insulinase family protein [Ruminococcaceae bacterium]|nr:insulinase family protein [Oscillospiraceae bacterium]
MYFEHTHPLLGETCISFRHSSGLTVHLIPKDFTLSYALLGVRYGSLDNRFTLHGNEYRLPKGIAHFLEHKMFENPDGEDTFLKFSRTGADANAYTTFCRTAYLFSCTDQFEKSLEILLESCFTPHFTAGNVEKEQGIIAEEISMYEDDPYDTLYFSLMRTMYENTDLGTSICGTEESIRQITPELLYACHKGFYRPDNMALCLCGNIDVDRIVPILDKVLGSDEALCETPTLSVEPESENVQQTELTLHGDVPIPLFSVGFKDTDISPNPEVRFKKYATMAILFEALFGGSSDFSYKLYKDGVITCALDYEFEHKLQYSYMMLHGESPDPPEVKRRLNAYLSSLSQSGIDPERLEGARRIVYSQFLSVFDRTESIANEILAYVFEDQDMLRYGDLVLSVTNDDCKALFDRFFLPNHMTFASLYPYHESEESK